MPLTKITCWHKRLACAIFISSSLQDGTSVMLAPVRERVSTLINHYTWNAGDTDWTDIRRFYYTSVKIRITRVIRDLLIVFIKVFELHLGHEDSNF